MGICLLLDFPTAKKNETLSQKVDDTQTLSGTVKCKFKFDQLCMQVLFYLLL